MNQITNLFDDAIVSPETAPQKRCLDIFLMPDNSGSTRGKANAVLNQAGREVVAELQSESSQHPDVNFRFRSISFANSAKWHIGPEAVDIGIATWTDLKAGGGTATGEAIDLLAQSVVESKMPERGLPPVMVLISDGGNTDGKDYDEAIKRLEKELWGAKAVRLSIGIGDRYDRKQLEKFTNHPEIGVLEAKNAIDLVNYIKYATVTAPLATAAVKTSTAPVATNVPLPPPPKPAENVDPNLMFAVR